MAGSTERIKKHRIAKELVDSVVGMGVAPLEFIFGRVFGRFGRLLTVTPIVQTGPPLRRIVVVVMSTEEEPLGPQRETPSTC
jgi:hypothetical protein